MLRLHSVFLLFVALSGTTASAHRDPELSRKLYQKVLDGMQVVLPVSESPPGEPRLVFQADGKMHHWIVRATRWVFRRPDCPAREVCVILDSDPVHRLLLDVLTDMEDSLSHAEHSCGAHCSHVKNDAPAIRTILKEAKIDVSKMVFAGKVAKEELPPEVQEVKPRSGILKATAHIASDLISLPPRIIGLWPYAGIFGSAAWLLTELGESLTSVHLFCTVNITLATLIPNLIHRASRNWRVHKNLNPLPAHLAQGNNPESWTQKSRRLAIKICTLAYLRLIQPAVAIVTYTTDKKRIHRISRSGTIQAQETGDGNRVRRFELPKRIPAAAMIRNHGMSVGSIISELWRKLGPIWKSDKSFETKHPTFSAVLRRLEIVKGDVLWPDVMIFDQGGGQQDQPPPSHSLMDEIVEIGKDADVLSRVWRTERLTSVLIMMGFWLGDENEGFFEGIWDQPLSAAVGGYLDTFPKEWAINHVRKSLQHFRQILLSLAYQEGPKAEELRLATKIHFENRILPMLQIAGGDRAILSQNGMEFKSLSAYAGEERKALWLALKGLECERIARGKPESGLR